MLLAFVLACGEPVPEYTIPTGENSQWEKWEEKGQKGPPVGEAKGPPPEDGQPQGDEANKPPPVQPGGDPPDPVQELQTGEASCRPIASSEPIAPKKGGVLVTGKVNRSSAQNGPLLLEFVQQGEQNFSLYSVACGSGSAFQVLVPPDLGEVYVAVFIDGDANGPSEQDDKGVSEKINITTEAISVETLTFSGSVKPLTLPFVLQVPDVDFEPSRAEDLPTDTTKLPPPETGEGGLGDVLEPPTEGDGDLPPPTEGDDDLPPPVNDEEGGAPPPEKGQSGDASKPSGE